MKKSIKVIAFDLDGTLTQHRSAPEPGCLAMLDALGKRYRLIMVGAGSAERIFRQLGGYPIDIIGNYGMQYCRYDAVSSSLQPVWEEKLPCDRQSVTERIRAIREKYGFTEYAGQGVQFHDSGCVTFPILGTEAKIEDKLRFDPDRAKRLPVYPAVKEAFPDYTVFIGGSSSFDFAPFPFNKYYALDRWCSTEGYTHGEIAYVGDDYGPGGNDEAVYQSDFRFVCTEDYRKTPELMQAFLE